MGRHAPPRRAAAAADAPRAPPQGEALGNARHGRGVHTCSNGDFYDGEWRRDLRHGQGLAVFTSGLRYEGAWRADKAHGAGAAVYANGDKARACAAQRARSAPLAAALRVSGFSR